MKKLFTYLFISVLVAGIWSCNKNDNDDPDPVVPVTVITLETDVLQITQAGGKVQIAVSAPERPEVTSMPEWITKAKTGIYSDYKCSITLTTGKNKTYEERTGSVTVKSGSQTATFTVKQAGKEVIVIPSLPSNDAVGVARMLGLGWNMGNEMEAHNNGDPDETAWTGVPCTQETFNGVAAKGFTSVRIPVTWINLIGEAPDYTLDADRLARLEEIVDYAHNAGLYTIFNLHHDGAESQYWLSVKEGADQDAIKDEITKVWTQLANTFKECGDWLIFESFNEINDGGWGNSADYLTEEGKARQNNILNDWNQTFVDAVRATGGNNATRWLGVPGYCADPGFTLNDGFVVPEDPAGKIMVGVHEYTPYHFCQTGEVGEWGHTRTVQLDDETYDEDYMTGIFSKLYNKWVANNVPVYLGEFGCANRLPGKAREFQIYWFEYMAKAARSFGLSGFIWDNGSEGDGEEIYGIVHHGTGEYLDPEYGAQMVNALVKGFTSEDEEYTLDSVYESAPEP